MVSNFLVWETGEIEQFLENERQESHGEKLSLRQAVAEVTEGHPCEELSSRKLTSPTLFAHTLVGVWRKHIPVSSVTCRDNSAV